MMGGQMTGLQGSVNVRGLLALAEALQPRQEADGRWTYPSLRRLDVACA